MRRRSWWLFFLGCLLVGAAVKAANQDEIRVTVDGQGPYPLKVLIRDKEPYLAVTGLASLQAEVVVDPEKKTASIGFGRNKLVLTAGSEAALFNGRAYRGAKSVVEDDEFWVHPSWLGLFDLKYTWEAKTGQLTLRWVRPYLFRVYLDKSGPEPCLVGEGNSPFKITVFRLGGPERLVIDLEGCYLYNGLALEEGENEYFYRLRAAQNRPGVVRVVADLRQPVGYRLDPAEAGAGRLVVRLNRLVFGAEVIRNEAESMVVIRTNHPAAWQLKTVATDRVTVEIGAANLVGPTAILPGDNEWFRGISCRQVAPDRVAVDVFLLRPGQLMGERDPEDETKIRLRPIYSLDRLGWREDGYGLFLTANGPLTVRPREGDSPLRLVFVLPYASATGEEGERSRGAVKRYWVTSPASGGVEVTLELRYPTQYRFETSPDRRRVEVIFTPPPLAGKTVVLDPGHGGIETGAIGRVLGLREKEVNLDIALRLKVLLEEMGAVVQLTRVDDTYVPLFSRAFFANRLPADIFLSIHANAHNDPNITGVEVFYYPGREEAGRLAGLVLEEMTRGLGLCPRGAKANDFAVLRDSQVVAVLVETAFLSNPQEEAWLATPEFRSRAAAAMAQAIVRFFRGERAKPPEVSPAVTANPGTQGEAVSSP